MSHPYRKLRTQTHRHIPSSTTVHSTVVNSNIFDHSFVNSSYQAKKQSYHKNNVSVVNGNVNANGSIPTSYYFDHKEKKQFIKGVIDGYFQVHNNQHHGNPQSYIKGRELQPQRLLRSSPRKQQQQIMPFAQKYALTGTDSGQNSFVRSNNRQHVHVLRLKNMVKTMDVKFFSQRSSFQSPQKSLPVIDELNEDGIQLKRPQSQQRSRYTCPSPTLKRRQSAGNNLCQSPKRQPSIANKSSYSNQSDFVLNDDDLAESVLINKSITTMSRCSVSSSQKSEVKRCKYYEIRYAKDGVIKTFNNSGMFLMSRQSKLKKLGAKTLQISNSIFPNQLQFTVHKPLTKQLFTLVPRLHGTQQLQLLYINEPTYSQLFKNNSQFLRDIIIELCKQLIQLQNKVIINKICLENVARIGEKCVRIIDWSAVSIKEKISNLDKISLVKITQPTLKQKKQQVKPVISQPQSPTLTRSFASPSTDPNISLNSQSQSQSQILKWLCKPQYLSPQIIQILQNNTKLDDQYLWKNSYSSDIWSLGCLIFQIITLIPLGTKDRYVIKGRNYNRKGLLYIGQFSYAELLRKQRLFSTQATRIIKKQCDSQFIQKIDSRVIEVMEKMLVFNRDRRIKPQEVINILNKLV